MQNEGQICHKLVRSLIFIFVIFGIILLKLLLIFKEHEIHAIWAFKMLSGHFEPLHSI